MDTPNDRVTTLERAQRLHQDILEQTQARFDRMDRNYAKLLDIAAEIAQTNDRIEDQLLRHIRDTRDTVRRHDERLTLLEAIAGGQQTTIERLTSAIERLDVTLQAIKDLLGRDNGH